MGIKHRQSGWFSFFLNQMCIRQWLGSKTTLNSFIYIIFFFFLIFLKSLTKYKNIKLFVSPFVLTFISIIKAAGTVNESFNVCYQVQRTYYGATRIANFTYITIVLLLTSSITNKQKQFIICMFQTGVICASLKSYYI